jgi:hypothetical protein
MNRRLELMEKWCNNNDYNKLYYGLKKCNDKAISMCYAEYKNGKEEHYHSNLYSCVYDFKNENNLNETMEELMQLCKDICFAVDRKFQVHNFKIENKLV